MAFKNARGFAARIALTVPVLVGAAHAEIRVSETMRMKMPLSADQYVIEPGARLQWDLPLNRNDFYEVEVRLSPDSVPGIGAFICPQAEYQRYLSGETPRYCNGVQRGEYELSFTYQAPFSGPYVFFLDNSLSVFSQKTAAVGVIATTPTPEEFRATMENALGDMMDGLSAAFIFEDFDVNVAPCGQENAFSEGATGNVTFCSELLFQLMDSGNAGAIMAVLAHELGHTLLNLWGEPNWTNEQTADEFATVFLLQSGGKELLEQSLSFFAGKDPIAEAVIAQYANSPHPLSVQRMRNITDVIDHPVDYMRRWTKVLYNHAQTAALQSEIDAPDQYSNPALARAILRERMAARNEVATGALNAGFSLSAPQSD
jgi:hypothetical protein